MTGKGKRTRGLVLVAIGLVVALAFVGSTRDVAASNAPHPAYAGATSELSVKAQEAPQATKQLSGWDHKRIGMALSVVGAVILAAIVYGSISGRRRLASAREAPARSPSRAHEEAPAAPKASPPALVFCGRCGTEMSRTARFCSQCGRELRLPPLEGPP